MSPTVKAIAYGIVSLAAFIIAAVCACRALLSPAPGCHASEGAPTDKHAPTLGDALAVWLRAASERLRWKLWGLLTRSRRVCAANAHGALIWRTRPVREILVDSACRADCALNGACWCGNLRDDDKLRERAAAACASPDGTAPDPALGAVPLEVRVTSSDGFPAVGFRAGKQPWDTAPVPRVSAGEGWLP